MVGFFLFFFPSCPQSFGFASCSSVLLSMVLPKLSHHAVLAISWLPIAALCLLWKSDSVHIGIEWCDAAALIFLSSSTENTFISSIHLSFFKCCLDLAWLTWFPHSLKPLCYLSLRDLLCCHTPIVGWASPAAAGSPASPLYLHWRVACRKWI